MSVLLELGAGADEGAEGRTGGVACVPGAVRAAGAHGAPSGRDELCGDRRGPGGVRAECKGMEAVAHWASLLAIEPPWDVLGPPFNAVGRTAPWVG